MPSRDHRLTLTAAILFAAVLGCGFAAWRLIFPPPSHPPASVLRVGYSPEPPFSFRTPEGDASGESPEVARAVLRRAGFDRVEWVQTEFGLLIPQLLSGRIDMIAAGMFVTEARLRQVAFTRPTLQVRQALLVRRGNPRGLHRYEDFAVRNDVRLCVLEGSAEFSLAVALGAPRERILATPDAATAIAGLVSGAADGLALSRPSILRLSAGANTAVEIADPFEEPILHGRPVRSLCAFALRPSDVELKRRIDAELAAFIGSLEHLAVIRVFGFGREDLP